VAGTGLYFGNLGLVTAGDEAARAAAAARRIAAESPASGEPKPTSNRQAATDLEGLLSQSTSDRAAIAAAVNDVTSCGPLLSADRQIFQQAAASRQSLINELTSLGLKRYLPTALLSDLTGAWQASEQADLDYAEWAGDQNTNGCTPNDQTDPGFQAASTPDDEATTDKKAFVSLWNPIASEYGLTNYEWTQL
jgi:hypothetical protein